MPENSLPRGSILGFDFGLRRIGVAVGQATTLTASSLDIIAHRQKPDWDAITRLVREWKPVLFVVGLPLGPEGEDTDMSRAARKFGNQLSGRYETSVEFFDERLSSRAAESRFAELRAAGGVRRKDARKLDAAAACIILENWMQSRSGTGEQT